MAEDVGRDPARRADEATHILDEAQDRHADLGEHRDRPPGVDQREILRGRDDDSTRRLDLLRERQLNVASAGGQIDHEDVEQTPVP